MIEAQHILFRIYDVRVSRSDTMFVLLQMRTIEQTDARNRTNIVSDHETGQGHIQASGIWTLIQCLYYCAHLQLEASALVTLHSNTTSLYMSLTGWKRNPGGGHNVGHCQEVY